MNPPITLDVDSRQDRLDLFLVQFLPDITRTEASRLIAAGHVRVGDRVETKKGRRLEAGDRVVVERPEVSGHDLASFPPLTRLYEDEYLLLIEKVPGMSVHPAPGEKGVTVLDLFRRQCPQLEEFQDQERPGIVHRLDKDTSGILVLAKTEIAFGRMQKMFKRREVQKTYLALVRGRVTFRNGTIDYPIARSRRYPGRFEADRRGQREDARDALTLFTTLIGRPSFSLLRLMPHTGRTHQLRVHLAAYGHPVLGDPLYGREGTGDPNRLALHAAAIAFDHPCLPIRIEASSPLPADLRQWLAAGLKREGRA
ncbi:MAG TPA: RluA family pseudouridine synthase [Candidatus Aminicenantes bacterium]|nr:RluA family pseudouridine synthase [Candidatus Aminicenantes bacterium]